jgi:hypothetical protein
MNERTTELLTHPLTAVAVVASALGSVGFGLIDPAWGLVSATAGMWFPAISVTAGVIFPEIGLDSVGTQVLIAAAVVFVAVQLDKLADRAAKYLKDR